MADQLHHEGAAALGHLVDPREQGDRIGILPVEGIAKAKLHTQVLKREPRSEADQQAFSE